MFVDCTTGNTDKHYRDRIRGRIGCTRLNPRNVFTSLAKSQLATAQRLWAFLVLTVANGQDEKADFEILVVVSVTVALHKHDT